MAYEDAADALYIVLINDEDQYSLWPAQKRVPGGWRKVYDAAPKEDCLKYVEANWTDMRPASLRKKMEHETKARGSMH